MRVHDLGEIAGTLLLWGGAYSNLSALRALVAEAERLSIPSGRRIGTGDVIAYCAEPVQTARLALRAAPIMVAGNCEESLANGRTDCGCGFTEGSACDLAARDWFAHASRAVGPELRAQMAGLPDVIVFRHGGRRVAVIHGGARDKSRFLWPVSPEDAFAEEVDALTAATGTRPDVVIAGHAGIAFVREVAGVLWLNAGAIGMPPNDGAPQTRFALLPPSGRPEICRLDYDPLPSVRAMRRAGLTQGYERALTSGWWPSEDVLPGGMRRARQTAGQDRSTKKAPPDRQGLSGF